MEESITAQGLVDTLARGICENMGVTGDWEDPSPVMLAYVGDAVYELILRTTLTASGRMSPKELHRKVTKYVSASAQSKVFEALESSELLTAAESDILRRGKNASPNHTARSVSMAEYHKATGVEALIGFLYLHGQTQRATCLRREGLQAAGLSL